MFIEALFVMTKTWKQPKSPLTGLFMSMDDKNHYNIVK